LGFMVGDDKTPGAPPLQSEGESNLSDRRREWSARNIDGQTRVILDEDARYFLHQSVSTPCLNAVVRAEGIWIEDIQGRRYMDFHGNNVHHIGYGHPRLKQAITAQMDALPFAPRRFASEPATALARKLAEIAPGSLSKILFATGGSDAIEIALKVARAATGRFKTISFWDSFHGAGFGAASIGGEPSAIPIPGASRMARSAARSAPTWCAISLNAKATSQPSSRNPTAPSPTSRRPGSGPRYGAPATTTVRS
jgi:4-aminobutyrate aminotransferase